MAYLLGLDIGTTSTRALIIDEEGRVVASADDEYPMHTPQPLWAEQDPADWWSAARRAIGKVLELSAIAPASVAGLGLTGQMHGAVLLDGENRVVRPAIIWCDQRSQAQCNWITQRVGAGRLMERTKPIPENVRTPERFYPLYRSLYGMLKPAFDQVTRLVSQK